MNNLTMKKFVYIAIIVCFAISLTSCGAGASVKANDNDKVAGYTLKNKKEIMEQQILHKKSKTSIVGL